MVHEVVGHVPMLADPAFCALAQAIGRASLGADEKQIWHLTKVGRLGGVGGGGDWWWRRRRHWCGW